MLRPAPALFLLSVLLACSGASDVGNGGGGGSLSVDAGADRNVEEGQLLRLTGAVTVPAGTSADTLWFFAGGADVEIHRADRSTCLVQLPEVAPGEPRVVTLGFAATTPEALTATDFVTLTVMPTDRVLYTADVATDGQDEVFAFDAVNGGVVRVTPAMPSTAALSDLKVGRTRESLHFVADLVTDDDAEAWTVGMDGTGVTRASHDVVAGGDVLFTGPNPVDDSLLYAGTVDDPGVVDAYVLDAAGAVRTKVTSLGAGSVGPTGMAWTPDGERVLLFGSLDGATGFALESVLPDGTGRVRLSPTLGSSRSLEELQHDLRDDTLVYRLWDPVSDEVTLHSANWHTGSQVTLVPAPLFEDSSEVTLRVSPDGTRVAYRASAGAPGGVFRAFAVAKDGSGHAEVHGALPAFASVDALLGWSQDSARVVYRADADTDGAIELYAASADGSSVTKLNGTLGAGESVDDARLTGDGRVVYRVDADPPRFYAVGDDGSGRVLLDATGLAGASVVLSAVSRQGNVAVCSGDVNLPGESVVVAVPLDGSSRRQLHPSSLPSGAIGWSLVNVSPAGTHAVIGTFASGSGAVELYVTDFENAFPRSMPSNNGGTLLGIDWSADGNAVVYRGDYVTLGRPEAFYIRATGTGYVRINDVLPAHADVNFAGWAD